jgi:hypothetical protein
MLSDLKYIYNEKGERESVVISISEWERIEKLLENNDSKLLEKFNPSDFFGIWKKMDVDWDAELINMRDEWERNI